MGISLSRPLRWLPVLAIGAVLLALVAWVWSWLAAARHSRELVALTAKFAEGSLHVSTDKIQRPEWVLALADRVGKRALLENERRVTSVAIQVWFTMPEEDLDRTLSLLSGHPQLRSLDISAEWCDDRAIEKLRGLPALEELSLGTGPITDRGLESIGRFRSLKSLSLASTVELTEAGLAPLANLTQLESLSIRCPSDRTFRWGEGIAVLERLPHLKTLEFYGVTMTRPAEQSLAALVRCRELESLRWAGMDVEEPLPLSSLAGLSRLRNLELGHIPLRAETYPETLRFSDLQHANLSTTEATDGVVEVLSRSSRLQSLTLSFTHVTSNGLKPLVACSGSLKSLDLAGTRIDDAGLDTIARLGALEVLDLSGTQVSDRGLTSLSRLKTLKKLNLSGCRIGDEGIRSLGMMPLEEVNAAGTLVRKEGLTAFAKLPWLRKLNLRQTKVTDDDLLPLYYSRSLESVVLQETDISDEACLALVLALDRGGSRQELSVGLLLHAPESRPTSPPVGSESSDPALAELPDPLPFENK